MRTGASSCALPLAGTGTKAEAQLAVHAGRLTEPALGSNLPEAPSRRDRGFRETRAQRMKMLPSSSYDRLGGIGYYIDFSGGRLIGWCHSVSTTVGPARIERAPAPSERAALSVGPRAVETRLGVEPSTTGLQPASHASEMRAALPAGLEPAISAFARQRPIRLDHESRSAPGRTRTSVWGTRFTVWGSRRCATDAWGDRRDSNPLRPASRAGSSPLRIRPPWAARDSNPQPSGCGPDALPLS